MKVAFVRGQGGIPRQSLWYCVRNEGYACTEVGSVISALCLIFLRDASCLLPGGGTRTELELFAFVLELWIPSRQARVAVQPRP